MEKKLDQRIRNTYYDQFLVEYYNGDRSASVHVGTMYYRVYFYKNGGLLGTHMMIDKSRADAEQCAKQWILERINEDQIDQLHKTVARVSI